MVKSTISPFFLNEYRLIYSLAFSKIIKSTGYTIIQNYVIIFEFAYDLTYI